MNNFIDKFFSEILAKHKNVTFKFKFITTLSQYIDICRKLKTKSSNSIENKHSNSMLHAFE